MSASSAPNTSSERGEALSRSLDAPSLGVAKSYVVWLPPGYASGARRYPVVYLLHGIGGNETDWLHHGRLRETADAMKLEAIVVMPDGDDGCYVNGDTPVDYAACLGSTPPFSPAEKPESYCVKTPRYEDYLVRDVVRAIDGRYRTIADGKHRALVGAAMGGFGAVSVALRHPDVFGVAASHSGFVAFTWSVKHPFVPGSDPLAKTLAGWGKDFQAPMLDLLHRVFGADLATYRAHDPAVIAAALTPETSPKLYFDCGTEDVFKLADEAKYFHAVLDKARVPHRFELTRGPHLFSLWKERLPKSLAFAVESFAGR